MHEELLMAADAFLAGVFLAVCYDILRIFRNIAEHSSFWIGIEDILYWCASGIYLFELIYQENDGMIRLYVLFYRSRSIAVSCRPKYDFGEIYFCYFDENRKLPGNFGMAY